MRLALNALGWMLLMVPVATAAQSDSGSSTRLDELKAGQLVYYETNSGVKRSGKLIGIGSDSLHFKRSAVGIDGVTRLRVRERTRARRYGIVGAIAGGALLGTFAYELNGLDDSSDRCRGLRCAAFPGAAAALGAIAGYGIGALLGSTWSTWRDVQLPLYEGWRPLPTGSIP